MALLLGVAAALGVLAILIATDPRRIGVFREQAGRTAAPGEAGWVTRAAAPVALTEVAAVAHHGRIWVAGGLDGGGRAVDRLLVYDPAGTPGRTGRPCPSRSTMPLSYRMARRCS